jgi:stearoyl-CoA desaturase (delta-9 desaturase)
VITCRYDVLAKYAKSFRNTYAEELKLLRRFAPQDARSLKVLKRWLNRDEKQMREEERARLAEALAKSEKLSKVYIMRQELLGLWERSNATREQLLKQLQDWCGRAEASGIRQLEEFSLSLRRYT